MLSTNMWRMADRTGGGPGLRPRECAVRRPVRRGRRAVGVGLAVSLAVLAPRRVSSHEIFEITAEARLRAEQVELTVTLSRGTALAAAGPAAAGDSLADPSRFPAVRPLLLAAAGGLFEVAGGGARAPLRHAEVGLTVENDVEYRLVYARPGREPLTFRATHLAVLKDPTYGAAFSLSDEEGRWLGSKLLGVDDPVFQLAPEAGGRPGPSFAEFLRLGLHHILTGYDHLLFLGGLLVACRRLTTMLALVTSFTVGHSLTLGLAALDLVAAPGGLVEPLIAASIAFVGIENLVRREEPKHRWLVTFAFGLVHGFGFAGALKETGLATSGTSLVVPLFAFNLGVELGQLAVAAPVVPALWGMRRWAPFPRYVVPGISVTVAGAGFYWLAQRTLIA
jgi:hypothetical protein